MLLVCEKHPKPMSYVRTDCAVVVWIELEGVSVGHWDFPRNLALPNRSRGKRTIVPAQKYKSELKARVVKEPTKKREQKQTGVRDVANLSL